MAAVVKWLGHGAFEIKTGEHTILLDPFLTDNPQATVTADSLTADTILITHGHFDHVSDAASIANRTGAVIIAPVETASWFESTQDVKNTVGMNLGGGLEMPWGHLRMTIAHHSSSLPDGSYGGNPSGYVLTLPAGTVYFAGDTALFMDMQLIGRQGIDLAVLPIGDHFTMGPADALEAVKMIQPQRVLPAHYDTWPPITQDAQAWCEQVNSDTDTTAILLQVGETVDL